MSLSNLEVMENSFDRVFNMAQQVKSGFLSYDAHSGAVEAIDELCDMVQDRAKFSLLKAKTGKVSPIDFTSEVESFINLAKSIETDLKANGDNENNISDMQDLISFLENQVMRRAKMLLK